MYRLLILSCLCVHGIFGAALLEATSESVITIIPADATTATAPTVGPADQTTIQPITIEPATGQTVSAPTVGPVITTIKPITIFPITTRTGSMPTFPAGSTTMPPATPKPEKQTGFDGGSFGGGIALGLGICIIALVVYKCYSARREKGYSTM